MTAPTKLATYEEFELFTTLPENEDKRFILLHGEIIEVSPSRPHSRVAGIFFGRLFTWQERYGKGELHMELRYKLPLENHNAMVPDVSFIADSVGLPEDDKPVPRMPDFALEVKSLTNTYKQQEEKAAYYIANGTRLVWLAYYQRRTVQVYRPGQPMQILDIDDTLDGGDVLPGFTLAVRDVFAGL